MTVNFMSCYIHVVLFSYIKVGDDEKESYDKDADVYWQPNAWADIQFSIEWAKKTLKEAAYREDDEFLLYCDHLSAQANERILHEIRSINGVVWFGVPGATDIWQPVDSGFGQMLKSKINSLQEEWLQQEENIDLWMGNIEQPLNVRQRRILITHWVGNAYNIIMGEEYAKTRYRCFEKTGCLITADGSEDEKIQSEGLRNYVFPPSLEISTEVACPIPESADDPDDMEVDDEIEETEKNTEVEPEIEDHVQRIDRVEDGVSRHVMVDREVKVLYNEWHTGIITWYNKKLDEFRVFFKDKSEDYLNINDFNGIDVILE